MSIPTLLALLVLAACEPPADDTGGANDTGATDDTGVADDTADTSDTGDTGTVEYTGTLGTDGGILDAGDLQLVFPPGAVFEDVDVTVVQGPPVHPDFVLGTTYTFLPAGLVFQQPVSAVFSYDPAELTVDESELGVAMYDPDADVFWGELVVRHPENDQIVAHLHAFPPQPARRANGGGQGGVTEVPLTPMHLTAEMEVGPRARLTWTATGGSGLVQQAQVAAGGVCRCGDADGNHLFGCIQPFVDADGDEQPDSAAEDGICDPDPDPDMNPSTDDQERGEWSGLQLPEDRRCTALGELGCWRDVGTVALSAQAYAVNLATQPAVYWFRILRWDGAHYYSAPSTDLTRLIVFGPNDPPEAPKFLNAVPLDCGGIQLAWTAETASGSTTTASTWRISARQISPTPQIFFEPVLDLGAYENHCTITQLEPGATYQFRLQGLNRNTLTGREQSNGAAFATATNGDTEFDLDVSPDAIAVDPGDYGWVDVALDRHQGALDIDVGFTTPDLCGIAGVDNLQACLDVVEPGVTASPHEEIGFGFHEETPIGRSIVGEVSGTSVHDTGDTGQPTTCSEPMVVVAGAPTPHPIPRVARLVPFVVEGGAGADPVMVGVLGSGFYDGSRVLYDDVPRTTTHVSPNELRFTLSGADLVPDPYNPYGSVTVENPTPGGGRSNFAILTVTDWELPQITLISPDEVRYATTPDFDLTVLGTGFLGDTTGDTGDTGDTGAAGDPHPGSVVHMNGFPLTTTVVSATEAHATVPAADLLRGANTIQVVNPVPAVGTSNAVDLVASVVPCPTIPDGEVCVSVSYDGNCEDGLVTSDPFGISCTGASPGPGAGCYDTFAIDSQVILTAQSQPMGGGLTCQFAGWSSCPNADGAQCFLFGIQDDTPVSATWQAQ